MGPKPKKRYRMANRPPAEPVLDPTTDTEMRDAYGGDGGPEGTYDPSKLHREGTGSPTLRRRGSVFLDRDKKRIGA